MNLDSLTKLYVHELKDLYSAENQIAEALPKLADKADDKGLKGALNSHLKETRTHIERLERIFKGLDFEPGGHRCKGIEGLIREGNETLGDTMNEDARDVAIVAACQRVEHYEMAGYGVARAYAEHLGRYADSDLLTQTLDEEGMADRKLSRLAQRRINFEAAVH